MRVRPMNPVQQAALDYIGAGLQPVPVYPHSKKPVGDSWQNLRVTPADVPKLFAPDGNIGLLLGDAGNGLIDIDLDCLEAAALAVSFLPATGFKSGRQSNPRSHFWYRGLPVPLHKKFEFQGACLLELRSIGQTVAAPSLHEGTSEQIIWHESEGDLPVVANEEISRAVRELAAAALLVRNYPQAGSRHGFALALSGFLLRQGWKAQRVDHFVTAIAQAAGDEEIEDRRKAVETTAERLENGETALGGTRLTEIVGREVFEKACEWLGFERNRFDVLPTVEAANVPNARIPDWPYDCLEGDYIAELTYQLYNGTAIPAQFLREQAALVLGAALDGKVGFPAHRGLSTRRYLCLLSERAQSCKGESWKRIGGLSPEGAALQSVIDSAGLAVLDGSGIGSGQYLAHELEQNSRAIVRWDELSHLLAVSGQQGSTLLSALKTLYESTSHWTGSFTNRKHGTDDARLSVLWHSTRATFDDGLSTRRGIGDGLLSRFTLCYCDKTAVVPVWDERDFASEKQTALQIADCIPQKFLQLSIDADAQSRMVEYARSLLSPDHLYPDHVRRLVEQMKVDCLLRCVFSGATTISLETMDRSILWAEHQLKLRIALWPPDAGDRVAAMTQVLLNRLRKGSASANDLRRAANVDRTGTHEIFARCLSALKKSGVLIALGRNKKGNDIYGLEESEAQA